MSDSSSPPARKVQALKTVAFDASGKRKYAIQMSRASNGRPFLRIVEGRPQDDGSYRRFMVTVWPEDFEVLFATLDEMRAYIETMRPKGKPKAGD